MEQKPLLSICIPTYNREKYLQETLDSIITQEGFSETDIDIIISDNASIDNTTEVVQAYQRRHKNIKYFRNTKNIGADRNVLKALQLGTGKYIWGITDDDLMLPEGLLAVRKIIKENLHNDIGFFQVNFNTLDKDGGLLQESFLGSALPTKMYDNIHKLYSSYRYIHNGLTYYSINIFSAEILSLELDNIPVINFPHSCIMGLISRKKAVFIGKNIIGFRTDNNSEDFHKISHFFYVFVICHLRYMIFLQKNGSCISQWQLSIILLKMIIYSCFLWTKAVLKRIG